MTGADSASLSSSLNKFLNFLRQVRGGHPQHWGRECPFTARDVDFAGVNPTWVFSIRATVVPAEPASLRSAAQVSCAANRTRRDLTGDALDPYAGLHVALLAQRR
jgi:hypothetical protein